MHPVDIAALALAAFGYWRALKRGLGEESYRLVRSLVPIAAGCGLYGLLRSGMAALPMLDPEQSGLTGLIGGAAVAFMIMRRIQKRLRTFIEAKVQSGHARIAGLIGIVRKVIQTGTVVLANQLTPLENLSNTSVLGRLIETVLGT